MTKASKIPTGRKYMEVLDLLADTMAYVRHNFELDGNDILSEAYENDELVTMILGTQTVMGALIALRQKTGCQLGHQMMKEAQTA